MMDSYQLFNYAEGILWLLAAFMLRKLVAIEHKHHSTACNIAIIGFVLFAASDFIEGTLPRTIHPWLWTFKISCGIIFLIARICYVGRKNFKWTDRYLLFFLFCISIAISVLCIST